ncbi:uncharacterized transporter YutK-like [Culicoides brevitarsis]|uniref:uncharacterized transporter YutK-like n=1 Tax=Culicoides brevitarsis TaxID=469753 RepID=UPI00307BBA97
MDRDTEIIKNGNCISDEDAKNTSFVSKVIDFRERHKKVINQVLFGLFNIAAVIYLIIASQSKYNDYCIEETCRDQYCQRFGILVIIYFVYFICLFHIYLVKPFLREWIKNFGKKLMEKHGKWIKIVGITFFISTKILLIIYMLVSEIAGDYSRLQSLLGIPIIIIVAVIFSNSRSRINWRVVTRGLFLQLIIALFTLKQRHVRNFVYCLSNRFLAFRLLSLNGAKFVFGEFLLEQEQTFAFYALTSLFFVSLVVGIFYYLGWIQNFLYKMGQVAKALIHTTYIESMFAFVRLYFGAMESVLFVQPFLQHVTTSELHAMLTAAFASCAISSANLYISLGAQPIHLITANVMSGFAGLGMSKIVYPETEDTTLKGKFIKNYKDQSDSWLDAGTKGISTALKIFGNVVAYVIAFIAAVSFLNAVLAFFGDFLMMDFKLEYILEYIFMPICWLIGIPWSDAGNISAVFGIKYVNNELLAYKKLMEMLGKGVIEPRSAAIATFVLSTFANPTAVAIVIATFVAVMPENRKIVIKLIRSSLLTAVGTSLMTASVAAFLMNADIYEFSELSNNGTKLNIHYV